MKARLWLIAVIILLIAALVFAAAMTGHAFVAALCALAAAVIAFYHFVRRRALVSRSPRCSYWASRPSA